MRYRSASIAPGVKPPAWIESEDASFPTLEDVGLRRCAASATEGEARFVDSWETEDTPSPQEGQKRAPSGTAAAQLGHGVKACDSSAGKREGRLRPPFRESSRGSLGLRPRDDRYAAA